MVSLQVYFSSSPARAFNLRPDTLAIMMHQANVGPCERVLCVDACAGLVATAAIERMGGCGMLCFVHAEAKRYNVDTARQLNVPQWLARSARHTTLQKLLAAGAAGHCKADADAAQQEDGATEKVAECADAKGAVAAAEQAHNSAALHQQNVNVQLPDAAANGSAISDAAVQAAGNLAAAEHAAARNAVRQRFVLGEALPEGVPCPGSMLQASEADLQVFASHGFTSAVIAAPRVDCRALLRHLLPLLLPCATVCIFASALQPLAEAFQELQDTKQFVALQVGTCVLWCSMLSFCFLAVQLACAAPAVAKLTARCLCCAKPFVAL